MVILVRIACSKRLTIVCGFGEVTIRDTMAKALLHKRLAIVTRLCAPLLKRVRSSHYSAVTIGEYEKKEYTPKSLDERSEEYIHQ